MKIIFIYDLIVLHCICILLVVILFFVLNTTNKFIRIEWVELPFVEILWTIYPTIILVFISIPSIYILYNIIEEDSVGFSLKVIGHQWYWTYDYSSLVDIVFDRYTKPCNDLLIGEFRLLDVDNRTVVPFGVPLQLVLTSTDVIHSFSLPTIRVKIDTNPGYLNTIKLIFELPGLYYGICSELCGSGHRQISICVESTRVYLFKTWIMRLVEWFFSLLEHFTENKKVTRIINKWD